MTQENTSMNIVYIATHSFMDQLGTALFSLLESSHVSRLNIYILSPDMTDEDRQLLSKTADETSHVSCHLSFISIKGFEEKLPSAVNVSGFHPIIFARLMLADFLPDSVHTVLYMDCDTLVTGSLKALERHVFSPDTALAAVPELHMPAYRKAALALTPKDTYFNSGVLLINLDYWREQALAKAFLSYYEQNGAQLLYPDQDIINHCCRGHIEALSHRFNLPPVLVYFPRWFIRSYQPAYYRKDPAKYQAILRSPSIIHYLGDERPWMKGNYNPYRSTYYAVRMRSPWKDVPLIEGHERYLFCYHILNLITRICPWFRQLFTYIIGIRIYRIRKKP